MTSRSSHNRPTFTHPYLSTERQPSTSTLASSVGEPKKMFFRRVKTIFKGEDLPPLLESAFQSSFFQQMAVPAMPALLAIPPIEYDHPPPLLEKPSSSSLSDSSWAAHTSAGPLPLSILPSIIIGMQGYQIHQLALCLTPTLSGITSSFHSVPPSPKEPTMPPASPLNIPPFIGISPYRSLSNLPLLKESPCQSSSPDSPLSSMRGLGLPAGDPIPCSTALVSRSSSGGGQIKTVMTTPTQQQNYSLKESMSMASTEKAPPHSQSWLPSPVTLARALYLLLTGKLIRTLELLICASYDDLFNPFVHELLEDAAWVESEAGINYAHYWFDYILQEEAGHFACLTYNLIHPDDEPPGSVCSEFADFPC